jgi:hypothetical protein
MEFGGVIRCPDHRLWGHIKQTVLIIEEVEMQAPSIG